MNANEAIVVSLDKDMQDLVTLFMKQRESDIASLSSALAEGNYEALRKIGHSLAGAGASYGFPRISEIGMTLEAAAKARANSDAARAVAAFNDYMRRLVVQYV